MGASLDRFLYLHHNTEGARCQVFGGHDRSRTRYRPGKNRVLGQMSFISIGLGGRNRTSDTRIQTARVATTPHLVGGRRGIPTHKASHSPTVFETATHAHVRASMVRGTGFEPASRGSRPLMLPLHHRPVGWGSRIRTSVSRFRAARATTALILIGSPSRTRTQISRVTTARPTIGRKGYGASTRTLTPLSGVQNRCTVRCTILAWWI